MNKKALTTILILAALSIGGFTYYNSDCFVNNKFKEGFAFQVADTGRLSAKFTFSKGELTTRISTKDFNFKAYKNVSWLVNDETELVYIYLQDENKNLIKKIVFKGADVSFNESGFSGIKTVPISRDEFLKTKNGYIEYKRYLQEKIMI